MQYVLFNPQAGNGSGAQQARALDARFPEETFSYTDMTTISDYAAWLGTLPVDASLIIAGGDGTLNRFLNDTNGMASRSSSIISPPAAETTSCMTLASRRARTRSLWRSICAICPRSR